jgi:hypothetical protein
MIAQCRPEGTNESGHLTCRLPAVGFADVSCSAVDCSDVSCSAVEVAGVWWAPLMEWVQRAPLVVEVPLRLRRVAEGELRLPEGVGRQELRGALR